jgi:ubiquitin C-terminal hydrolase
MVTVAVDVAEAMAQLVARTARSRRSWRSSLDNTLFYKRNHLDLKTKKKGGDFDKKDLDKLHADSNQAASKEDDKRTSEKDQLARREQLEKGAAILAKAQRTAKHFHVKFGHESISGLQTLLRSRSSRRRCGRHFWS